MHAPHASDLKALERLVKYLSAAGRLQYGFVATRQEFVCVLRYRFCWVQRKSEKHIRGVRNDLGHI